MMTDPIADMLTRIRNGNNARHSSVEIPASKMKKNLVQILLDEGFIEGYNVIEDDKQGIITVDLKYGKTTKKLFQDLREFQNRV